MIQKLKSVLLLGVLVLLTAGCSGPMESVKPEATALQPSSCYIVFDAGSSGTRLFVYEKQGTAWREHQGPKVSALADPVREFRGKKNADIDAVTAEVVSALDGIKQQGPADDKGKAKWPAFDWTAQCHVESAMVYATAGMRIAEQENAAQSKVLWDSLKQKLQAKVGEGVPVTTRTLTGFEEGLYAWLAVRHEKKTNRLGISEMGGASAQVAFPCPSCDPADDAVKPVLVDGKPVQIYSYSFLGLGQDEAPKVLGVPAACAYGAGASQPKWTVGDCGSQLVLRDADGIRDPYNYSHGQRGTHKKIPTGKADVSAWVLTGAFNYLDDSQIGTCCASRGQCYEQDTSCFRPVYLDKYLQTLNIPKTSEKMDASWTLGAAVCAVDGCLKTAQPLVCNWRAEGCL